MSHGGTEEIGSASPPRLGFLSPRGCHCLVPAQWVVPLLRVKKALHIPFLGMQQVPRGCAGIYSTTLLIQYLPSGIYRGGAGLESIHPGAREAEVLMFCAGMPWENRRWSLLLATSVDCAHFAPKISLLSPARYFLSLRVSCHWKES